MKIVDMKCNRIKEPLGYTMKKVRLSWMMEGNDATTQLAARIWVAYDKAFEDICYDSEKREDIDSIGFILPLKLKPCTRYYWKVQVWTDGEDVVGPISWFETAKMEEPWIGRWITPDWSDKSIHPILRKSFQLSKKIAKARLYICGLGLYEAEINGKKVGDEHLTPYCNSYNNWIQYQTFDVTDYLEVGDNAMGTLLGNGWYKGRFGFRGEEHSHYGDTFAFLSELVVTYTDGSSEVVVSDESWKSSPSHILEGNIYDGEFIDGNKEQTGWSLPLFSDMNWSGTRFIAIDSSLLEARRSVPVRIKERMKPIKVIHTSKGISY